MSRNALLFTLIALACAMNVRGNDEVLFAQLGLPDDTGLSAPIEAGNCIVTFSAAQRAVYRHWGAVEIPENATLSVDAKSGRIRKIIFKFYSTGSFTPDTGAYDAASNIWTGDATNVTLTNSLAAPLKMYVTGMLVVYDRDMTLKEPYAVRSEYIGDAELGNEHYASQLSFYFDSHRAEWEFTGGKENVYGMPSNDEYPQWNISQGDMLPTDLVVFDPSFAEYSPSSTASWFENSTMTRVRGMQNLNTTQTHDMEMMFSGCSRLAAIDLSHFDTSSASNLNHLFEGCSSLETLDLSAFTINGNSLRMLHGCSSLKSIVVSSSMVRLQEDACDGVGTASAPCVIAAPATFDFSTTTDGTFLWKSGYFTIAPTAAVAASQVDLSRGGQSTLDIFMTNGNATFNGFQMDIHLPEGISLTDNGTTFAYELGERYSSEGFEVIIRQVEDSHYRLMGYSLNNVAITGSNGRLLSLVLQAGTSVSGGTYSGQVSDVSLSTVGMQTVVGGEAYFDINVSPYQMGDVDHSGIVNVVDVMMTINHVLGNFDYNYHNENADMDFNGKTNVVDIMTIITLILETM